jgi:hypothetical protein
MRRAIFLAISSLAAGLVMSLCIIGYFHLFIYKEPKPAITQPTCQQVQRGLETCVKTLGECAYAHHKAETFAIQCAEYVKANCAPSKQML